MRARVLSFAAVSALACSSGPSIDLPGGSPGIGFDDLRWSPRLGRVLVPAARSGTLDLVDPESGMVTPIAGFSAADSYDGGHDTGVTSVDDTGRWLLATDRTSVRLEVVDPDLGTIVAGAALGSGPDYVRWVAATREAWVTEPGSERIETVALREPAGEGPPTLAPTGSIAVPGGPESLVVDPVRGRAYTHLWDGATVAIDVVTHAVVAAWPNGCGSSRGIALDEERGFLFVSCSEGRVVLIDVSSGARLSQVWPVDGSDVIDYDPIRRHLYVSGQWSANLAVIGVSSTGEMAVLGLCDAAIGAHCVVSDHRGRVFLCDPDAGRLLVREDGFDPITH